MWAPRLRQMKSAVSLQVVKPEYWARMTVDDRLYMNDPQVQKGEK
jgi:hypothetical protein